MRVEPQVNERDEDFRAGVFRPLRQTARRIPEGFVMLAFVGVAERVEGLKLARLPALRIILYDRINRVDFRLHLAAHVRYDAILVLLARQLYRLSNLFEKIYYGRAPQLKSVRVDNSARRHNVAQVDVYLEAIAEACARSLVKTRNV